ncbi:MAG: alpha/beta hydrolase [Sneathiellaceae bacterium]
MTGRKAPEADPAFDEILAHSRGKAVLADGALEDVRRMVVERAKSRPGPPVARVDDVAIPGPAGAIPLRLYVPEGARGLALAFHGGGWMMGSLDSFDPLCRNLAVHSGAAIASVDYRLAPEHPFPAAVEDACAASAHLGRHAASLHLPEGPLVLFGESAGANLAAVAAIAARDAGAPKVLRQILAYPAVDARGQAESLELFAEGYLQTRRDVEFALRTYALGHGVPADDWRLSPIMAESLAGVAPAFILSAECDAIRDDSAAYADRLRREGVPVVHVRYAAMIHTFVQMRNVVDAAVIAQRQLADEIRRAFEAA